MISDKERREVAEKLRERTKKPMGKSMQRMFTEALGMYTHNICWMNPDKATSRWDVIVNYLADLIDIPTCVMTNVGGDFENSFQCSNCMNEFDMPDYDRYPYKRCPECGAVVLDGAQN